MTGWPVYAGFTMMLLTVSLWYRWFLRPIVSGLGRVAALQLLLAVHCLRFISPISLVPGATVPGLATGFTLPQVLGDTTTALLALVGIGALRSGWRFATPWVWFTNLFGLLDLAVVAVQGVRFDFAAHVGAMFYVVVWLVPWLLVSHLAIFARLGRGSAGEILSPVPEDLAGAVGQPNSTTDDE